MVVRIALLDASLDEVQQCLIKVPGVARVVRVLDSALPIEGALLLDVTCNHQNLRELYSEIKSQDWVIAGLNTEGHTLEDTFRELTQRVGSGSLIDGAKS